MRGLVSIVVAACLVLSCGPATPKLDNPNVVFVVVDTLRVDHTNLGGYERSTTPFLAELVDQGALSFTQVRSTAPWTKPSVASMMTGMAPQSHAVLEHPHLLHSALPTLQKAYQSAGFQTAGFQTNVLLSSVFGFQLGFETYDENHIATHLTSTGAELNRAVSTWLDDERDGHKPFFMYVHHFEPHFDYLRSGEQWGADYAGRLQGTEKMEELIAATDMMEPADLQFVMDRYDSEIRYQDDLLRELWAIFGEHGLQENTLFVVTADHGEEFREHGNLSHQYTLYDELVHVPFLALGPDNASESNLKEPKSLVNVGATLLDWSGVDVEFPGTSFMEPGAHEYILSHTLVLEPGGPSRNRHSLLLGGFKLIRTDDINGEPDTFELYHIGNDPGEQANLASAFPDMVEALTHELVAALARQDEQAPKGLIPEKFSPTKEMLKQMAELGYF